MKTQMQLYAYQEIVAIGQLNVKYEIHPQKITDRVRSQTLVKIT